MKAIRIHTPGGPEALTLDDVPEPTPGAGQAVVKLAAAGVNYIDVYFRTGAYKAPLPLTNGQRERRFVGAGAEVDVDVVDAGRRQLDHRLPRPRGGLRHVVQGKSFRSARRMDANCFHGRLTLSGAYELRSRRPAATARPSRPGEPSSPRASGPRSLPSASAAARAVGRSRGGSRRRRRRRGWSGRCPC